MRKFLRTLLGTKDKSSAIEENIPNLLAATGLSLFTDTKHRKQIEKLKISEEEKYLVSVGLLALGMFLVFESIKNAVYRTVSNKENAPDIIQKISNDTQEAFTQQLLNDGIPQDILDETLKSIIIPIIKDIENYYGNMKGSYPGNKWGVISIGLWKILGEQKALEVITRTGFFEYMEIRMHFDHFFMLFIKSFMGGEMADHIDNMLRSPMGNQYGI